MLPGLLYDAAFACAQTMTVITLAALAIPCLRMVSVVLTGAVATGVCHARLLRGLLSAC